MQTQGTRDKAKTKIKNLIETTAEVENQHHDATPSSCGRGPSTCSASCARPAVLLLVVILLPYEYIANIDICIYIFNKFPFFP